MTGTLPKQHKAARIIEHIVLVLALVWAGGCALIWTQIDMPHSIVTTTSSDGTCEVAIGELGSPMFFGPSTITIKVSWDTDSNVIGAENVTEIKTDLHNDGKSLTRQLHRNLARQHPNRHHPWRGTVGPELHVQLEITTPDIAPLRE